MLNLSDILQIVTFLGIVFLGLLKWYWQSGRDTNDLRELDFKVNDIDKTVRKIEIDVALIKGRLTAPSGSGSTGGQGGFLPPPLVAASHHQKVDSDAH